MWIAIFIGSLIAYIILAFFLLPKYFLRIGYAGIYPTRIDKVVDEKYTSATVYKHEGERYIDKYVLVQKSGYKEIICKLQHVVKSIVYDVVMFDSDQNPLNIITIKEEIKDSNFTKEIKVPNSVAYVTIVIKKVNNVNVGAKLKKVYNHKLLVAYIAITAIMFFALSFILQFAVINLFGDVFFQDLVRSSFYLVFVFISLIVYAISTYLVFKFRKF